MRVRYTFRARSDLDAIFAYLDERSPAGARTVKQAIERRIASLADFPIIAPESAEPGVRDAGDR
jgi:plasmid stabilization system protein ParE